MKPACWEACFLYPCPTVEHSNNCLLLLCVLFLKPSGHYTKIIKTPDYKNYKSVSLPFTAPNDGYICGGVYSLGTTACYIYINNTQVGWNHSGGGSNTASPFMYPLSKGDIVTAIGYDQFRAYFIYTK
ncbi:hypothetical protein DW839_23850 [Enterocloster bolteae]|uniref:Uncharacterized protein n=1 Tax=Enterocloster bolteae TaxID=208479 RepID=A0A414ANI0_9FIRM|nr:hypothetical protein DW839_23850 [Enterocloster bolteae]